MLMLQVDVVLTETKNPSSIRKQTLPISMESRSGPIRIDFDFPPVSAGIRLWKMYLVIISAIVFVTLLIWFVTLRCCGYRDGQQ